MNQTLLAVVGVVVFFITVTATLIYGYYFLEQLEEDDAPQRAGIGRTRAASTSDEMPLVPDAASTSPSPT